MEKKKLKKVFSWAAATCLIITAVNEPWELRAEENPPLQVQENPDGPGNDNQNSRGDMGIFVINGVECEVTEDNKTFTVPDDFDFNGLNIVVKKLNDEVYDNDEFASGTMFDEENRDAMEIRIHQRGENVLQLGIEFHDNAIGNVNKYPHFYLTQITLLKDDYRGIGIETNNVPDMYSFDSFQKADLSETTAEAPGYVTTYYGDDTIKLISDTAYTITDIQPGAGVPKDAVTIDVAAGTVQVHSNYYTSIPLTVTLSDGTTGYMQIERIGLQIEKYQWVGTGEGQTSEILHGAAAAGSAIPTEYYGKSIFTATFYHSASEDYKDYNMIANIKLSDGTTETRIVKGIGTKVCQDEDLAGSDYIVWSGDEFDFDDASAVYPVSVSVTAVKAGAADTEVFGGASFGAGAGVNWIFVRK